MHNKFKSVLTLLLGVFVIGLFNSAHAAWNENFGGIVATEAQDVVVSLKSNPMANPEAACLAVTFARSLSMPENKNVTLFVTLDGVTLADKQVVSSRRFKCHTPWGKISLLENLEVFLDDNDNNMVVCPLCWESRYGDDELPDYGVLPGTTEDVPGTAIGTMIFNADKILDF